MLVSTVKKEQSQFSKSPFFNNQSLFLIHPDYIHHHYCCANNLIKDTTYYHTINVELYKNKLSSKVYLPFIFEKVPVIIWKF